MGRSNQGQGTTEYVALLSVVTIGIVGAAYGYVAPFRRGVDGLAVNVSRILVTGTIDGAGFGRHPTSSGSPHCVSMGTFGSYCTALNTGLGGGSGDLGFDAPESQYRQAPLTELYKSGPQDCGERSLAMLLGRSEQDVLADVEAKGYSTKSYEMVPGPRGGMKEVEHDRGVMSLDQVASYLRLETSFGAEVKWDGTVSALDWLTHPGPPGTRRADAVMVTIDVDPATGLPTATCDALCGHIVTVRGVSVVDGRTMVTIDDGRRVLQVPADQFQAAWKPHGGQYLVATRKP